METRQDKARSLDEVLQDESLRYTAPAHLRARILDDIEQAASHRQSSARWRALFGNVRAWWVGSAAGVVTCVLILSVVTLLWQPSSSNVEASEIVSSHVRALLSQHPIDVVSTDKHTVKPWFNGRIDYAPPVVDLATQGFPLVGGRLDYVEHRLVAVMVYHFQKHPIDLYVFPAKGGSGATKTWRMDGYALARWQQDGMVYWAITDAEPAHLREFVQDVRAATR